MGFKLGRYVEKRKSFKTGAPGGSGGYGAPAIGGSGAPKTKIIEFVLVF